MGCSQQTIPAPSEIEISSPNQQSLETVPLPTNSKVNLLEIQDVLKQQLAEALYIDVSEIEEEQQFIDLGLDSIVGVEWVNKINQTYNLNIKATELYEHPTLQDLTTYIADNLSRQSSDIHDLAKFNDYNEKIRFSAIINEPQMNTCRYSRSKIAKSCNIEDKQTIPAPSEIEISSPNQQSLETVPLPTNSKVNLLEIQDVLKQQLAEALYIDVSEIEEEQQFIDLGLDSIVGVEWVNKINQTYNLNIKATELYEHPTLQDLTTYVADNLSRQSNDIEDTQTISDPSEVKISSQNQQSLETVQSSINSQETIRQKVHPILEKVANHELTIQQAKQIIQEINQQSQARNHSAESSIKNNSIVELIKKYTYDIVPELTNVPLRPSDSLQQLGIDSMNRAEIIMMIMEELNLNIPLIELAGVKNIGEIADLFTAKLEVHHYN